MSKLTTTVVDAIDSVVRRLQGQRLCANCGQWAPNPHRSGGKFFCDRIHASIYFARERETIKKAMEKKRTTPEKRPEPGKAAADTEPPPDAKP